MFVPALSDLLGCFFVALVASLFLGYVGYPVFFWTVHVLEEYARTYFGLIVTFLIIFGALLYNVGQCSVKKVPRSSARKSG